MDTPSVSEVWYKIRPISVIDFKTGTFIVFGRFVHVYDL
jgi:hypothetical protein